MKLRLLLLLLALAGCPELATSPPLTEKCAKEYDKCKLPSGPLEQTTTLQTPSGEPGPCFKCMPQH
jgi:hypothetical protein